MAKAKGTLELELKSTTFLPAVKKVLALFTEMEAKGKSVGTAFKAVASEAAKSSASFKTLATSTQQATRALNTNKSVADIIAKSSYNNMKTQTMQTGQAIQQMGAKSKSAVGSLNQLSQSSKTATGNLKQMGTAANQAGSGMGKMASQAKGGAVQVQSNATSVTALTTSTIALTQGIQGSVAAYRDLHQTQIDIEAKEVSIEQIRIGLVKGTQDAKKEERELAEARAAGTITMEEYQFRMERLQVEYEQIANDTKDLEVNTRELELVKQKAQDAWINMATTLGSTVVGAMGSVSQIMSSMGKDMKSLLGPMNMLKGKFFETSSAATVSSGAVTANNTAMSGGMSAGIKLRAGLTAAGQGFKNLMIGMGPIGWAIIGISTAWLAWETNLGGFRDIVHKVIDGLQWIYEGLEKILFPLKLLRTALQDLGIDLGKNIDDWQEEEIRIREAGEAMDDTTTQMAHAEEQMRELDKRLEESETGFNNLATSATESAGVITTSFGKMNNDINRAITDPQGWIETFRTNLGTLKTNSLAIFGSIAREIDTTTIAGAAMFDEWIKKDKEYIDQLVKMGDIDALNQHIADIDGIADHWNHDTEALKEYKAELNDLKKNFHDVNEAIPSFLNVPPNPDGSFDWEAARENLSTHMSWAFASGGAEAAAMVYQALVGPDAPNPAGGKTNAQANQEREAALVEEIRGLRAEVNNIRQRLNQKYGMNYELYMYRDITDREIKDADYVTVRSWRWQLKTKIANLESIEKWLMEHEKTAKEYGYKTLKGFSKQQIIQAADESLPPLPQWKGESKRNPGDSLYQSNWKLVRIDGSYANILDHGSGMASLIIQTLVYMTDPVKYDIYTNPESMEQLYNDILDAPTPVKAALKIAQSNINFDDVDTLFSMLDSRDAEEANLTSSLKPFIEEYQSYVGKNLEHLKMLLDFWIALMAEANKSDGDPRKIMKEWNSKIEHMNTESLYDIGLIYKILFNEEPEQSNTFKHFLYLLDEADRRYTLEVMESQKPEPVDTSAETILNVNTGEYVSRDTLEDMQDNAHWLDLAASEFMQGERYMLNNVTKTAAEMHGNMTRAITHFEEAIKWYAVAGYGESFDVVKMAREYINTAQQIIDSIESMQTESIPDTVEPITESSRTSIMPEGHQGLDFTGTKYEGYYLAQKRISDITIALTRHKKTGKLGFNDEWDATYYDLWNQLTAARREFNRENDILGGTGLPDILEANAS